jgi:hypothetical protein
MTTALSHSDALESPARSGPGIPLGLAAWLALVLLLGAAGVFVTPAGAPPLMLLSAATAPVLVFLAAFRLSPGLHEVVLAADLRFLTAIQAWRIGGFTFLALYAYGVLPGYFAWPAGLGDMAIGISAPWILAALLRRPRFAKGRIFVIWQVLGTLDLIVAVGMGAMGPRLLETAGADATAAMAHLPLVLVPGFFVPMFIIIHMVALLQARQPELSEL